MDSEEKLHRAETAGKRIRYFLDGGNDTTFATHDDVAILVIASVSRLLSGNEADALAKAAGFEWKPNHEGNFSAGGFSLVKIKG